MIGTLTDGNPKVVPLGSLGAKPIAYPLTVFLNTTAVGKKIELSVDGGVLYFTPTYDPSNASQLIVGVLAPISHVRFTGAAADIWGIK